jgi:hypothetical protein
MKNRKRGDIVAKTDIPSKRLIQLRPKDWAKVVLKDNSNIRLIEMKPDKNPKVESRLDSLFWVEKGKEDFILNIEPQGYYEAALPARMLRYRSDIWEYTISGGRGIPSIKQVVVFFYPKDDNKEHKLRDERKDNSNISFSYDVVKVWELEKDYIIDNELIGLYSLLPLMEVEADETDEEVIAKSVRVIETIEDEALRGDSLAAMSIMSKDRYSSDLIKKYVRREMLMSSPLFEEWVSEERKEAAEKNSKETIIFLLESKFDFVSSTINKQIQEIEDLSILKGLTKKVLTVSSIGEFEELLEKVRKLS